MKISRLRSYSVALLAAALIILPIAYTLRGLFSPQFGGLDGAFAQSFLGSWASTSLGVLVGMPIALWVNRFASREADLIATQRLLLERDSKRRLMIDICMHELQDNKKLIARFLEQDEIAPVYPQAQGKSLLDSGLLADTIAPNYLTHLATAYERLDLLNRVNARLLEGIFTNSSDHHRLVTMCKAAASDCLDAISALGNPAIVKG